MTTTDLHYSVTSPRLNATGTAIYGMWFNTTFLLRVDIGPGAYGNVSLLESSFNYLLGNNIWMSPGGDRIYDVQRCRSFPCQTV